MGGVKKYFQFVDKHTAHRGEEDIILVIQSWLEKFVLGCVNPSAGAVARSHNLGQTFLANSVKKSARCLQ